MNMPATYSDAAAGDGARGAEAVGDIADKRREHAHQQHRQRVRERPQLAPDAQLGRDRLLEDAETLARADADRQDHRAAQHRHPEAARLALGNVFARRRRPSGRNPVFREGTVSSSGARRAEPGAAADRAGDRQPVGHQGKGESGEQPGQRPGQPQGEPAAADRDHQPDQPGQAAARAAGRRPARRNTAPGPGRRSRRPARRCADTARRSRASAGRRRTGRARPAARSPPPSRPPRSGRRRAPPPVRAMRSARSRWPAPILVPTSATSGAPRPKTSGTSRYSSRVPVP